MKKGIHDQPNSSGDAYTEITLTIDELVSNLFCTFSKLWPSLLTCYSQYRSAEAATEQLSIIGQILTKMAYSIAKSCFEMHRGIKNHCASFSLQCCRTTTPHMLRTININNSVRICIAILYFFILQTTLHGIHMAKVHR